MTFEELKTRLSERTAIIAKATDLARPTPFSDLELCMRLDAPQIVQPNACRVALALLVRDGLELSLNVGAGGFPSKEEGWVNLDSRPLAGIDLCIDALEMDQWVPPESCSKILNKDVLEHFGWKEGETVLQIWWRLLKKGGELETITPDMRTVMRRYLDGEDDGCNWLWVMYHLYGMQTYPYNFHKSLYDFPTLGTKLKAEGFSEVIHMPNQGNHLHVRAIK